MSTSRADQGTVSFPIREAVDVRIAMSNLNKLPWMEQASEIDRALIATILCELGTNIVKYADYGRLTVEFNLDKVTPWVKILAQDNGPGIADIGLALKDHYTTGNTLGLGLPGVKRMADDFSITSTPDKGTTIVAIKGLGGRFKSSEKSFRGLAGSAYPKAFETTGAEAWDVGSYTRPMLGQISGGDLAIVIHHAAGLLMVMVDITGHGERAFELSNQVNALVQSYPHLPANELMMLLHRSLAGTIGAAIGILNVDPHEATFAYLGVGNTGVARVRGKHWRGVSRDGLVGSRLPKLIPVEGELAAGDVFLLWTDGISEIDGPKYLRQNVTEPAKRVATQLVTTLGKPHDDAGCIVFRWRP